MPRMVNALVAYGPEPASTPRLFEFAERVFAVCAAQVLIATWERPPRDDDEPGAFTTVETDLADLAARLAAGSADSFQLMSELGFHERDLCYVGVTRPPHAPLSRLCVIWPQGDAARDAAVLGLAREVLPACGVRYGYGFVAEDAFDALDYALGSCMTALSDDESALLGHRALAAPQCGEAFCNGRLRMVYPSNWLNAAQLTQPLADTTLREWIAADAARGTLTALGGELSLWQVPVAQLAEVNRSLGAAGLLVAWRG